MPNSIFFFFNIIPLIEFSGETCTCVHIWCSEWPCVPNNVIKLMTTRDALTNIV